MSANAKKRNGKKPTAERKAKPYTVHYSYYLSDSVEIEATSEEEAKEIASEMLAREVIGRIADMDIGESKVWVD